jgi:two-component system phosphate regulon sensor histidine kinase PhoR
MRRATKRLRVFTRVIIFYLILALVWWSILLFSKNKEAFDAHTRLLELKALEENSTRPITEDPSYIVLYNKYKKQEYMIYGEAAIFILSLGFGIYLMNRGFFKEIKVADQQKNFLLSITHELKSPVAGIKLAIETIKSRKLEEHQLKLLTDNALKESDRLNELIGNLLLAARMDGAYNPVLKPLNIKDLISEAVENQMQRSPEAAIVLEIPDEVYVMAEPEGLNIVFKNLLENGIKYNIKTIPQIHITAQMEEKGKIVISFSDNGVGIPVDERDLIFEKFYRIGSEDTRKSKGTGLGLYIVMGIVRAHEGNVRVQPSALGGSTFLLEFPTI